MSATELNVVLNKYVARLVLKLSIKHAFSFDEAMASLDVKPNAGPNLPPSTQFLHDILWLGNQMSATELNVVLNKYVAKLVLKFSIKYAFSFDEEMASLDVKPESLPQSTQLLHDIHLLQLGKGGVKE